MRRIAFVCGMIVLLLILVTGDIALRFALSGRFEPFFNSLAIFTLDFSCILLLATSIRGLLLHQRPDPHFRTIIAIFLLLTADGVAVAVRFYLHDRTREHVQELLAERLRDPSRTALINSIGNEMIDVEVFHCQQQPSSGPTASLLRTIEKMDLMALLNGNQTRRETYVAMLERLDLLRPGVSIKADDLMLPARDIGPWLWIISICALFTVLMYAWLVYELSAPDMRRRTLGIVAPGEGRPWS